MEESEKSKRIVEARMKLKERFEEKIKRTPSVSDDLPMGSGKTNRHGMPSMPVGQFITTKWPLLDLGMQPNGEIAMQIFFVFKEQATACSYITHNSFSAYSFENYYNSHLFHHCLDL